MLVPMGLLRTLGAVVDLERLHITHTRHEQQCSTLVLHSSGHTLMNVAQDMESWREAFFELELAVRTLETEALVLQFAITADDSPNRGETDPSWKGTRSTYKTYCTRQSAR